ncbi:MAG: hypothetical protein EOM80_12470 [Erysipelotrichia bacterium]|nr:hypothetical protein [Erysipelotrichia bacterium]
MKRILLLIAMMALVVPASFGAFAHDGNQPVRNNNIGENSGHKHLELKVSLLHIQRLFDLAENSFYQGMGDAQVMEYALVLNRLERELVGVLDVLPATAVNDMQNIQRTISDARFTLLADNNVGEANRLVGRADINFGALSSKLIVTEMLP